MGPFTEPSTGSTLAHGFLGRAVGTPGLAPSPPSQHALPVLRPRKCLVDRARASQGRDGLEALPLNWQSSGFPQRCEGALLVAGVVIISASWSFRVGRGALIDPGRRFGKSLQDF